MENPQLDFLERIKDDLENVDPVLVNTAILEMKNKPIITRVSLRAEHEQ